LTILMLAKSTILLSLRLSQLKVGRFLRNNRESFRKHSGNGGGIATIVIVETLECTAQTQLGQTVARFGVIRIGIEYKFLQQENNIIEHRSNCQAKFGQISEQCFPVI